MRPTHILFVEDEELIRLIVSERLVEAGLKVTEVSNGEAAIGLLQERCGFDLLLTDVHMPGRLSGIDVALRMRSLWPAIPVVFVTGRPDVLHAFGPSGPYDSFVVKPYRPTDALAAIQTSLARRAS